MKAAALLVVTLALAGCAAEEPQADGMRAGLAAEDGAQGGARVVLRYLPHDGERSLAIELTAMGERAIEVSWRGFSVVHEGATIPAVESDAADAFPTALILSPGTNATGIVAFGAAFPNAADLHYGWDGVTVVMSGVCRLSCESAS